eukprot:125694_1
MTSTATQTHTIFNKIYTTYRFQPVLQPIFNQFKPYYPNALSQNSQSLIKIMSQAFIILIVPTSAPTELTCNFKFYSYWNREFSKQSDGTINNFYCLIYILYFILCILRSQSILININKIMLYTAIISFLIISTSANAYTLFTTLSIGTDYSVGNGNMFDICAKTNVQITSLDVNCKAWPKADPATFQIYMTTQQISYVGCWYQCWTQIHDETKTCNVEGVLTELNTFNQLQDFEPVLIDHGNCRGFYVTRTTGLLGHIKGVSEGNIYKSNNEIDFKEGIAMTYLFGGIHEHSYGPRVWNGMIHYNASTFAPTVIPTNFPTSDPAVNPTTHPTVEPTHFPSINPSQKPTLGPTLITSNPSPHAISPTKSYIIENRIILKNDMNKIYLLFLLLLIPLILYPMYRFKKYRQHMVIDKALVLIIGISNFNDSKLKLPGIKSNVTDLEKLWKSTYNYTVCICNADTLSCSKQNVIDFIDKYKEELMDVSYKAVVVHILSHGVQNDCFLTSDLKIMPITFIQHELITTAEFANNFGLLKLIFHHACRGNIDYFLNVNIDVINSDNNDKVNLTSTINCCFRTATLTADEKTDEKNDEKNDDNNKKKEIINFKNNDNHVLRVQELKLRSLEGSKSINTDCDPHANCVTIYGNIEERALSDQGEFTNAICNAFDKNHTKYIKDDFLCLIREIGIELEKQTNKAQICTSKGVGTLRQQICFIKCTEKQTK